MVVSEHACSFLAVHPRSLVKVMGGLIDFFINNFPSFLTLVPLKIIHSHAKSGSEHHLITLKGIFLFNTVFFPVLTPASPAVPRFLQLKRQDGPCLLLKKCCSMDV